MNHKRLLLALVLPLVGCSSAIGAQETGTLPVENAPTVSRTLAFEGFDTIDLSGCDKATVRPGASFSVTARGPQRDLDLLRVSREGKRLTLDRKADGCTGNVTPVVIEITMPALREIDLSGGASMTIAPFSIPHFDADLSGAGELDLLGLDTREAKLSLSGASELRLTRLVADTLALDLSGASQARAIGAASVVSIDSSGASETDVRDLTIGKLTASASGDATIRAKTGGRATLSASGTSTMRITGGGACTIQKSGLARVTCD